MKKAIVALLLLAACKGPAGSNGSTGLTGPRGDPGQPGLPSGHFEFITGPVTSDDFTVTDPRVARSQQTTVYISDGTRYTALNTYLPGAGKNAFYVITIGPGTVEIVNGKTAGGSTYLVDVYLP